MLMGIIGGESTSGGGGGGPPPAGGPTTGAHRYWRINVTASTVCSITELEFWQDALTKHATTGGTVIASGTGEGAAANVFDGDTSSGNYWYSGGLFTGWIGYDFGSGNAVEVAMVALIGRYGAGQYPTDFDVQYSDNGSSWTTAWSVASLGNWLGTAQKKFFTDPAGGFMHWKLQFTTDTSGAVRLAEAELRETAGGADVSGSRFHAVSHPSDVVGTVADVFDDLLDSSNEWAATAFPCSITAYFPGAQDIAQVTLTGTAGGLIGQGPDDLTIYSSPDGSTWTSVYSTSGLSWSTANEVKTFTI